MSGVIHFAKLEELGAELLRNQVVRVSVFQSTIQTDRKFGIELAGIGTHVRSYDGYGHILSCYIPVKHFQMMAGKPLSGDVEVAQLWVQAEAEAAQIRAFLRKCGADVRAGIIDLGDVQPIRGRWGGLDGHGTDELP